MKKILVMAVAVVSAAVSQASYLYWQTGTAEEFNGNQINGYQMVVTDGTTTSYLTPTWTDGTEVTAKGSVSGKDFYGSDAEYKIDVSAFSAENGTKYSFYIELIGYDTAVYGSNVNGVIGVSETQTYAQLLDKGSIVNAGLTSIPTAWTGGSYAAPEPTSGLLMLLGVAALGLKRRKA